MIQENKDQETSDSTWRLIVAFIGHLLFDGAEERVIQENKDRNITGRGAVLQ